MYQHGTHERRRRPRDDDPPRSAAKSQHGDAAAGSAPIPGTTSRSRRGSRTHPSPAGEVRTRTGPAHRAVHRRRDELLARDRPARRVLPARTSAPPWWFLDAPDAIPRFRSAVTETAGFYRGPASSTTPAPLRRSPPATTRRAEWMPRSSRASRGGPHRPAVAERKSPTTWSTRSRGRRSSCDRPSPCTRGDRNPRYAGAARADRAPRPGRIPSGPSGLVHRAGNGCRRWGIAAFTGRSADRGPRARPQDGLYTLIRREAEADTFEVIDSIVEAHDGNDLAALTDPAGEPHHRNRHADHHRGRLQHGAGRRRTCPGPVGRSGASGPVHAA